MRWTTRQRIKLRLLCLLEAFFILSVDIPFGLSNAAQNMSKLMDLVLGFDLEPKVFVYLDDIIIATNDFEEHI